MTLIAYSISTMGITISFAKYHDPQLRTTTKTCSGAKTTVRRPSKNKPPPQQHTSAFHSTSSARHRRLWVNPRPTLARSGPHTRDQKQHRLPRSTLALHPAAKPAPHKATHPTGMCSMSHWGRGIGSSALDTRACLGHDDAASTPCSLQATDQTPQPPDISYPVRRPCQSALKFTCGLGMIPALR